VPTFNADACDERAFEASNGLLLRIRPLRPGETKLIREFCARLSLRTRYRRFFSPLPFVPESLLQVLAAVDDPQRLTLIAELDAADGAGVVAVGNAVGLDDNRAEMALVVADAWQQMGIGVALAASLLAAADLRGFDRFVAHGLWDNPALRPILRRIAHIVSTRTKYGVSEITFVRGAAPAIAGDAARDPQKQFLQPSQGDCDHTA
jgi:acetyltransferase